MGRDRQDAMSRLSLTLLGGFQAQLDSGRRLALPTRKSQALLAYLALPVGRPHPRDTLAALLWGGTRQESARAGVRQALFFIRRALGDAGSALKQDGDTLALEPTAVDTDTAGFERLAGEGTPEALARAAQLYTGDLLSGFALDEPPFEEWLLGERERLRELAVEALARLLAHQMTGPGTAEKAVHTALQLLGLDPLQEPVHRTLMRLYVETGRRGAGLRQYQQCVAVLQRDLGIEPETETKLLYQEILRRRDEGSVAETAPVAQRLPRAAESRSPGAGDESDLVSRAAELAEVRAALESATGGAGRVVVVLGEAGIGKSRLVIELAADAARKGVTVLLGRSYESEQILPFGPWVDALRAGDVVDDLALLERLGPLRPELARLLPEIGGATAAGATEVGPVFESVTQLIGHLARSHPVLLVLEDLHWADDMSARLLAFVGRRLGAWPVLLVATAREDELAGAPSLRRALDDLAREPGLTKLALQPLSQPDTLALVRTLARNADESWLERVGDHAWRASEGNPFVAVETVRAHAQGATLDQERGLGLPERVRELVGRRLERLSERAQAVTAVASVIGREFDFPLLQGAAGLGEEETAAALEELVRARVLHGLGERFDFAHDRIRDVAQGRILAPRQKLIHRRVAEAIEATYAGQLERHALALGRHYRAAEVWDPAAYYLGCAGRAAGERGANQEAVACFDAALQCLGHLPESQERSERVIDTILEQEESLLGLGKFQESLQSLREGEALARSLGDRRRLGHVFGRFAYHLGSIGDLAGATTNADEARAIALEFGDLREQASANVQRARASYARGDYRRALEAVRENDALAQSLLSAEWSSDVQRARTVHVRGDHRRAMEAVQENDAQWRLLTGEFVRGSVAFSRVWGILALAELGEFEEAMVRGDEALRASAMEPRRHEEVWTYLGVGRLHLVKGDVRAAVMVLERGLPLCGVGGDFAVYFSRTASSLGSAYALSGRLPEALPLLERANRHAEALGFVYGHALVLATLAEARLLAGDVQQAGAGAARALALARQYGQRGWQAWALRLLGEIAARGDSPDVERAEECFHAAIALAEERGMRPLLAHCHRGLGAMAERVGQTERAQAETARALEAYRALDMAFWVAPTQEALARLEAARAASEPRTRTRSGGIA
jgi:DNA-binding SARP family transcriptional activator/tetratricopeptide (TPR) repeat protein